MVGMLFFAQVFWVPALAPTQLFVTNVTRKTTAKVPSQIAITAKRLIREIIILLRRSLELLPTRDLRLSSTRCIMSHGSDSVLLYTNLMGRYHMKNECFSLFLIFKNQLTLLIYSATMHQLELRERTDSYSYSNRLVKTPLPTIFLLSSINRTECSPISPG